MKNRNRIRRRIAACLLLLCLLLPAVATGASAELLPGIDGIGGNATTAPMPEESTVPAPEAKAPSGENTPEAGNSDSTAWGILIALGIAGLAVAVIFLVMPTRESEPSEREERR